MTRAGGPVNRSKLIGLIKVLVSAALLLLVWRNVSSRGDLAGTLAGANTWGLIATVGVFAAGQCVAALRLQFVLRRLRRHLEYREILRAHFIGIWFNQMLPTGFGGDIAKLLVLRRSGDTLRFTRGVLLARAFGLIALLFVAVAVVPFLESAVSAAKPFLAIAAVAVGILAGLGLLMVISCSSAIRRRLPRPFRFLVLLLADMRRFARRRALLEQAATSLLVVLSVVACFAMLGWSLGRSIPLFACMVIVPPIIVSMHLPLSYGGWGIREVGAVALLPYGGVPSDVGFLVSVLYGLVILVSGLAGLVVWHLPHPGVPLRSIPG